MTFKTAILAGFATVTTAGMALAGIGVTPPPPPMAVEESNGDIALIMVVLLGALIVAATVNRPKPPTDGPGE